MPKPPEDDPSPRALARVDEILTDVDDPGLRTELEGKLRKKFAGEDRQAEQNQAVFNDAYKRAIDLGIDEPAEYAQRAVQVATMQRFHLLKVNKIRRAPKQAKINAADRAAALAQAASKTANPTQRRKPHDDLKYLDLAGRADRQGVLTASGLVGAKIEKPCLAIGFLTGTRRLHR